MKARNYCAHPNILDHWKLRCMNRCPDLVVCLKRDLQCLRPQASLVLIYRPNVAGMKGKVDLALPVNRTPDLWCGNTIHYHSTLFETKTLGVSWKPNLYCFLIKVKVCLDSSYTKRDVLSAIAKIFDRVGLMAPVISKAKIFLQRLWRSKLEWNDLLVEEYREWHQFLVSLENINNIEIPRRILVAFPEVIEIHGFADA
ncbi:uncharacterized protein TNCV_607671 [Trichonephila clavipes]|nr:uncharacterized protein TNCV_607671 [Trichonephila clavipes]